MVSNILPLLVGLRFAKARRQRMMAKFISLSSIFGIALGCIVLIVGLSAMNGFERELNHRILGVVPSARIFNPQGYIHDASNVIATLKTEKDIVGVTPNVLINGLLSNGVKFKASQIRGVDVNSESDVVAVDEFISHKDGLKVLSNKDNGTAAFPIILGNQIMKKLSVQVGDNVELMIANFDTNGKISSPISTKFKVVASFKIGGELDAAMSFIDINDARKILNISDNSVTDISLRVADNFKAYAQAYHAAAIASSSFDQNFYLSSWEREHGYIYNDIQLVRTILYLALFLIISVASFNIISCLIMAINDKRSEIAILMSLGYSKRSVMQTFIVQGMLMGGVGVVIGSVVGVFSAIYLTQIVEFLQMVFGFKILNEEVYYISFIPSEFKYMDLLLVVGVTIVITFISTIVPAFFATRIKPARELAGK